MWKKEYNFQQSEWTISEGFSLFKVSSTTFDTQLVFRKNTLSSNESFKCASRILHIDVSSFDPQGSQSWHHYTKFERVVHRKAL